MVQKANRVIRILMLLALLGFSVSACGVQREMNPIHDEQDTNHNTYPLVWTSAPIWIREIRDYPGGTFSLPFLNQVMRILIAEEIALSDNASAMNLIQVATAMYPSDGYFPYRMGLLLLFEAPTRAGQYFSLARTMMSEYEIAIRTALMVLEANDEILVSDWLILGDAFAEEGDWNLAEKASQQAIQKDPFNADAHAMLGQVIDALGGDGLSEFSKAITLEPNSVYALALIAHHWMLQNQFDKALEYFNLLAIHQPGESAWQINIGNTALFNDEFSKALDAFTSATRIQRDNPKNWQQVAQFCLNYSIQVDTIGLDAARQALILAPNDPLSSELMGRMMLYLDDKDNAEKFFNRALALDPEYSTSHYYLGVLLLSRDKKSQAYNHLFEVIHISGNQALGNKARQFLENYFSSR